MDAELTFKLIPGGWIIIEPLPGKPHALNIVPGQSGNNEPQVSRLDLFRHFSDLTHVDVRQGALFP